jgi:hypothetical protein
MNRIRDVGRFAAIAALALLAACGGGDGGGSGSSSGGAPPPPPASPPAITGPAAALPAATAGTAATGATLVVTGTAPITFAVSAGALPDGMTLNATSGAIGGTPLVSGSYNFTITATNGAGSASASFSQLVQPAIPNANLLLEGNRILSFNTQVPTDLGAPVVLNGMSAGETLVAITRRQSNGYLYGFAVNGGGQGRLYAVHPSEGRVVPLGAPRTFHLADGVTTRPITGTRFGMHFAAPSDILRITTDTGQNFRWDPSTGLSVDGNPLAAQTQMDGNINGPTTRVDAVSFTDNRLAADTSQLYTIDSATDAICVQTPNSGVQQLCVALSAPLDAVYGFDMPGDVATPVATGASAIAIFRLAGETTLRIAPIELTSGVVATSRPALGITDVRSFALQSANGIPMYALRVNQQQYFPFTSASPANAVTRTFTGVNAGETIVGFDFRPGIGQLYGLGIDEDTDTGTLYHIRPQTGICTPISSGAIALTQNGAPVDFQSTSQGYGFDFDPVADQIRVVTGTDVSFRISPSSGLPVDGDTTTPGTQPDATIVGAMVTAIAFTGTNDFVGGFTTLYAIDTLAHELCVLATADGTRSNCLPLRLNGVEPNFIGSTSFDIAGNVRATAANAPVASGSGWLAGGLLGSDPFFYEVNLATGTLTNRGPIGDGTIPPLGLAIGTGSAN